MTEQKLNELISEVKSSNNCTNSAFNRLSDNITELKDKEESFWDKASKVVAVIVALLAGGISVLTYNLQEKSSESADDIAHKTTDLQNSANKLVEAGLDADKVHKEFSRELQKSLQEVTEKTLKMEAILKINELAEKGNCIGFSTVNALSELINDIQITAYAAAILGEKGKCDSEQEALASAHDDNVNSEVKYDEETTPTLVVQKNIEPPKVTIASEQAGVVKQKGSGWIYIGKVEGNKWFNNAPQTLSFDDKKLTNYSGGTKNIGDMLVSSSATVDLPEGQLLNVRTGEPSFFGKMRDVKDALPFGTPVTIRGVETTFNDHVWAKVSYERNLVVYAITSSWTNLDIDTLLTNSAKEVWVTPTGTVSLGLSNGEKVKVGPHGYPNVQYKGETINSDCALGSLLIQSTKDISKSFCVNEGDKYALSDVTFGNKIKLKVNAKFNRDNFGGFNVQIEGVK
ncbi:hypothetical protein AADZ91_17485 [Colwelliaceae bacterium 6441]